MRWKTGWSEFRSWVPQAVWDIQLQIAVILSWRPDRKAPTRWAMKLAPKKCTKTINWMMICCFMFFILKRCNISIWWTMCVEEIWRICIYIYILYRFECKDKERERETERIIEIGAPFFTWCLVREWPLSLGGNRLFLAELSGFLPSNSDVGSWDLG